MSGLSGLWMGYKISSHKNKQKNQQCSEGASMTALCMRGGDKQAQSRKKRLADSNYFYTEESIPCMNFRVCNAVCMYVTYTIVTCMQFVKAIDVCRFVKNTTKCSRKKCNIHGIISMIPIYLLLFCPNFDTST